MKTSTLVGISATFWIGGALIVDQYVAAAIFAVGHILFWQNHALEVKVNKLLDERELFVGRDEIDR